MIKSALALVPCLFAAVAWGGLAYDIQLNHTNSLYRIGERAQFEVTVTNSNGSVPTSGLVRATLDNFGPARQFEGTLDLSVTNRFVLCGQLDEPGFLRLIMRADSTRDAEWSVGYEVERIVKGSPSPTDFDDFWAGERARLRAEVPVDFQCERWTERSSKGYDFYRVSFATFGRRIYAFMSVPKGDSNKKWPLNIGVNAAGFGNWTNNMSPERDAIRVQFSVYPFQMDLDWHRNGLKSSYDQLNAECRERYGCAYWAAGISDSREKYFYHSVILGIDRAIDYLVENYPVDINHVVYAGTSQGGGMGLALAALNKKIVKLALYVPAITDTMGYLKGRESGWPKVVESNSVNAKARAAAERWAPYFDGANFASRITCPVRVAVGFSDMTCPAPAVYATFNALSSKDKAIEVGLGMTHDCHHRFYRRFEAWLKE